MTGDSSLCIEGRILPLDGAHVSHEQFNFRCPLPHVAGSPDLEVSGRRWRIELPRCLPPSAAQTVHAVFPHTAFTKTHASGMLLKVLVEQGSPAHTHRTAWFQEVVANHCYAIACIGVTGFDVRSSR